MTKPRNQHITIHPSETKIAPKTDKQKQDDARRNTIRRDYEDRKALKELEEDDGSC